MGTIEENEIDRRIAAAFAWGVAASGDLHESTDEERDVLSAWLKRGGILGHPKDRLNELARKYRAGQHAPQAAGRYWPIHFDRPDITGWRAVEWSTADGKPCNELYIYAPTGELTAVATRNAVHWWTGPLESPVDWAERSRQERFGEVKEIEEGARNWEQFAYCCRTLQVIMHRTDYRDGTFSYAASCGSHTFLSATSPMEALRNMDGQILMQLTVPADVKPGSEKPANLVDGCEPLGTVNRPKRVEVEPEEQTALLVHVVPGEAENWHSGQGWYYWCEADQYDACDRCSVGAFETREEAISHAKAAGYSTVVEIKTSPRHPFSVLEVRHRDSAIAEKLGIKYCPRCGVAANRSPSWDSPCGIGYSCAICEIGWFVRRPVDPVCTMRHGKLGPECGKPATRKTPTGTEFNICEECWEKLPLYAEGVPHEVRESTPAEEADLAHRLSSLDERSRRFSGDNTKDAPGGCRRFYPMQFLRASTDGWKAVEWSLMEGGRSNELSFYDPAGVQVGITEGSGIRVLIDRDPPEDAQRWFWKVIRERFGEGFGKAKLAIPSDFSEC